jgi:hypothetical protein
MIYGQWNYPRETSEGKERALISINEHLEDATAIIIQSITDEIIKDFK